MSLQGESHAARRVGDLAHLASVKDIDIVGGGVLGRYSMRLLMSRASVITVMTYESGGF